ncbi:MAG: DUF3558 domain-containing protein [Pseudonocardiaceae bacterium]
MVGVVATGCLILLAGCGGTGSDLDQPDPRQPSASAVSPIPSVNNPRDVAAMARRTCELLPSPQAAGFGLDLPPQQSDGLFGTVRCVWRSTAPDRSEYRRVGIGVFTNNLTLEAVYSMREDLPFFELTEVGGYPAIVTRSNADLPICDIDVKPAERQSVTVSYESGEFDNDPQQACVVGKRIAESVVLNLPTKS